MAVQNILHFNLFQTIYLTHLNEIKRLANNALSGENKMYSLFINNINMLLQ